MAASKVYKCTNCDNFQCLGLKVILNHLYCVHSQNLSFKTKCVVPDCAVQFTKYNSLYKHVIKHHSKLYNNNNYNNSNGDNNDTALNCGNEELNIPYSSDQLLEITNQNSNIDECSTRSPTTDNNDFFVDDDDDIDDHYYSDEVEDDNEVSYLCYKFHYLYYLYLVTNFFFHRVKDIIVF